MKNKILVELYVPLIEERFDIFIPSNEKIYQIIQLMKKGIYEISDYCYPINADLTLINRTSGKIYDSNVIVKNTDINNGVGLILL